MDHTERLKVIAAVTILLTCAIAADPQAQSAPSVPNLIAYQGLVTLAGGSPVANGSYPATFTIYNYSSGGASLWSENANVTTNGGRFSHNLGSMSALPSTLSFSNDSLWLAVTFNGELLTPRSRIVGNAYSLTANNLEGNNGVGIVSLRANSNAHQISQYGSDGGEQMRMWGPSYAELVMDGSAIDNSTDDILLSTNSGAGSILRLRKPGGTAGAVLHSGGAGAGGSLTLTNDAGASTVFMDGDLSSDASVLLPAGAISSTEEFNEPGAASDIVIDSLFLTGAWQTLASRTIVTPAAGYLLVLGECIASIDHNSGSQSYGIFGVSTSSGSVPNSLRRVLEIELSAPDQAPSYPISVHGLIPVSAGSVTVYLLGEEFGGTWAIWHRSIIALYIPTAYGSVDVPTASVTGSELDRSNDPATERALSLAANSARIAQELEIMSRQSAEQAERIRKLEEAEANRSKSQQSQIAPE